MCRGCLEHEAGALLCRGYRVCAANAKGIVTTGGVEVNCGEIILVYQSNEGYAPKGNHMEGSSKGNSTEGTKTIWEREDGCDGVRL